MKVNRSSWHYQLNEAIQGGMQHSRQNLCRYFWTTIGSIGMVLFVTALLSGLLFCVGMAVYEFCTAPASNRVMISYLVSMLALPALSVKLFRYYAGTNTAIETPNFWIEFAKAKKNKFCPLIEFV